jgi:hypothetical protein
MLESLNQKITRGKASVFVSMKIIGIMKVHGTKTNVMARVMNALAMVTFTKVTMLMAKSKVKECTNGKMETYMMGSGMKVRSMDMAFGRTH